MDRRAFMALGGTALAASATDLPLASAANAGAGRHGRKPLLMKLGCQSAPSTEEHFAFFARYGIHNICAKPTVSGGRLYSTVDELNALRAMAERHQISVDMVEPILLPSSHIDREA